MNNTQNDLIQPPEATKEELWSILTHIILIFNESGIPGAQLPLITLLKKSNKYLTDYRSKSQILLLEATYFINLTLWDAAISILNTVEQIGKKNRDMKILNQVYGSFGDFYYHQELFELALPFYHKNIEFEEIKIGSMKKIKAKPELVSYNFIATIIKMVEIDIKRKYTKELDNLESWIDYVFQYGKIFNDSIILLKSLLLFGDISLLKSDYENAKKFYEKVINHPKNIPTATFEVESKLKYANEKINES